MRKVVVIFLLVFLIGVGVIIIMTRINTENVDNTSSSDHLDHFSAVIKEIDNEQKKLTTEIIGDSEPFNAGEQLILDMSKEYDYYNYQSFETDSEIKVYYFPYQLKVTDDITSLIFDDAYNTIDIIK